MGPGGSLAAAAAVVTAAASWLASCWRTASRFAGEAKDLIELCKGLVPPCTVCPDSQPVQDPRPDSASWLLVGLSVGFVAGLLLGSTVCYLALSRRVVPTPLAPAAPDRGQEAAAGGDGTAFEPDATGWVPKRATRPGRCLA